MNKHIKRFGMLLYLFFISNGHSQNTQTNICLIECSFGANILKNKKVSLVYTVKNTGANVIKVGYANSAMPILIYSLDKDLNKQELLYPLYSKNIQEIPLFSGSERMPKRLNPGDSFKDGIFDGIESRFITNSIYGFIASVSINGHYVNSAPFTFTKKSTINKNNNK